MTVWKRSSYRHKNQTSGCQEPRVGGGDQLQRDPRQVFGAMEMFSIWMVWWLYLSVKITSCRL